MDVLVIIMSIANGVSTQKRVEAVVMCSKANIEMGAIVDKEWARIPENRLVPNRLLS